MSRFMEQIHIGRFGAFEDYRIGPFERGLNVVYGPNEAGKSTIASFVGGVLFGWEEAHGVRNTYSPVTGERSGALVFSDGTVASRENNEDGLKGDAQPTNDIDSATFKTMAPLGTRMGRRPLPARKQPSVITASLSVMTHLSWAPALTTVSCRTTQFSSLAPFSILTPRKMTQFFSSPSM